MVPRRTLQPLDITARHGKRTQLARTLFLGASVCLTFLLPLWHLRDPDAMSSLVGAPTSLSLWGLELVDPALALGVALVRGVGWSWAWTVLPGAVLVLLLGRFFCGWACPYLPILAASNAARWLLARLGVPLADVKVPRVTSRVVLVGALALTALTGSQLLPLVYPPALIGREVFRAVFFGSLSMGAVVVLGAFLFDTFISRAGFCRALCPGGAMFSVLSNLSPLRVKREKSKCTDCTVCDVVCNLGQRPMTDKLDAGCERCGKCVAACPTQALAWSLAKPPLLQQQQQDRP